MAEAESELPRGVEFELVALTAIGRFTTIGDACLVVGSQTIERRRRNTQSDTEGRILQWTDDDACRDVGSITGNGTVVADKQFTDASAHVFRIFGTVPVVHVVVADGETQVDAVIDVAADVEVVLSDVAGMFTLQGVVGGFVVVPIAVPVTIQVIGIEVIQLVAGDVGRVPVGITVLIKFKEQIILCLDIGELVLGSS